MAYVTGTGTTIYDLIEAINTLATTGLASGTNWALSRSISNVNGRKTECIWCGVGTGSDKIYVGARVYLNGEVDTASAGKLQLNGFAGYDANLTFDEQPGGITKNALNVNLPTLPMANNSAFTYWIMINTQRIIVVVKMSTQYESAYIGLFNPVSSERQYAYPMIVSGSACGSIDWSTASLGNGRGSMVLSTAVGSSPSAYTATYPTVSSDNNFSNTRIRRPDGTWRGVATYSASSPLPFSQCNFFPYTSGNQKLIATYNPGQTTTNEDFLLFPIAIVENYPQGIIGILDDVTFISGTRDIASEQVLLYSGEQYIVFDTMSLRGTNTYFAVKLA